MTKCPACQKPLVAGSNLCECGRNVKLTSSAAATGRHQTSSRSLSLWAHALLMIPAALLVSGIAFELSDEISGGVSIFRHPPGLVIATWVGFSLIALVIAWLVLLFRRPLLGWLALFVCLGVTIWGGETPGDPSSANADATKGEATAMPDSHFVVASLPRGVRIEVPRDWGLLSEEQLRLIGTSVEASLDLTGLSSDSDGEVNLLTANTMSRSTYAAVRVDSLAPPTVSPDVLSALSDADIKGLQPQMRSVLERGLTEHGLEIEHYFGTRREQISGYPALVTDYRRNGPHGPVIVRLVQLYTPTQEVSVNLSYRESEKVLWMPVINKMYRSLDIDSGAR